MRRTLLPCPCCRSTDVHMEKNKHGFRVECYDCGLSTCGWSEEDIASEMWIGRRAQKGAKE